MSYGAELTKRDRLDEMIRRERDANKKVVCHGLWVNGKLVPESEEHLYIDAEGNWIEDEEEWCACGGKKKLEHFDVCEDCL